LVQILNKFYFQLFFFDEMLDYHEMDEMMVVDCETDFDHFEMVVSCEMVVDQNDHEMMVDDERDWKG